MDFVCCCCGSLLDLVRRRLKVDSIPARLEGPTGYFLRTCSHWRDGKLAEGKPSACRNNLFSKITNFF